MTDHWEGCWTQESHPACRLARIRILEAQLATQKPTPCLTHEVVVPLHGEGPTWSHVNDEPPVR